MAAIRIEEQPRDNVVPVVRECLAGIRQALDALPHAAAVGNAAAR